LFFLLLSTTPKFRWYKSNRGSSCNDHAVSIFQIFKQFARRERMKINHGSLGMYLIKSVLKQCYPCLTRKFHEVVLDFTY